MKKLLLILPLVFLNMILLGRAEDAEHKPRIHRLDYIHYDPVTQSVEWGVSAGTIDEAGEFMPTGTSIATYSMNLQTGTMTHNGENSALSPHDADVASRVFDALSGLMQVYTEGWDDPKVQDSQGSDNDGSVERIHDGGGPIATPRQMHRPFSFVTNSNQVNGSAIPEETSITRASPKKDAASSCS
jgi:hypothetical protein